MKDIGQWDFSEKDNGVIVELRGFKISEIDGQRNKFWTITDTEGNEIEFRSGFQTAMRRFANIVETGEYRPLLRETHREMQPWKTPKGVTELWEVLQTAYMKYTREHAREHTDWCRWLYSNRHRP